MAGRQIPLDVAAALIDATHEEALAIGERLIQAGMIDTSGDSVVTAGDDQSTALSSVRMAYLYGELARAFIDAGYGERASGLLGEYFLKAGDAESAIPMIDAAAASARSAEVIEPASDEAGVAATQPKTSEQIHPPSPAHNGTYALPALRGRNRLQRQS